MNRGVERSREEVFLVRFHTSIWASFCKDFIINIRGLILLFWSHFLQVGSFWALVFFVCPLYSLIFFPQVLFYYKGKKIQNKPNTKMIEEISLRGTI